MPADPLPRAGDRLKARAFVDGGARGNPGPAGYGVWLELEDGHIIEAFGYLGETTNNVAEYSGLISALEIALQENVTQIEIVSDSQLLVRQMLGEYRVKHPNLTPLFLKAIQLARRFRKFEIRHTPRAGNKDADRLANLAIDSGETRVSYVHP